MTNLRKYYRRTEANRLLNNLTEEVIRAIACVGEAYFDFKEGCERHNVEYTRKGLLKEAIKAAEVNIECDSFYVGRGKNQKVSELRMEAAMALVRRDIPGLEGITRSAAKNMVYPMPSAPRPLIKLQKIVDNTPDYDRGFPTAGGIRTGNYERVRSSWPDAVNKSDNSEDSVPF
jgi:hypothetical protein